MRITAVILSHSCDMYYSCDMYCISHCITHVTCISNMHAGRAPDWQQQLGKPRCHDGQGQACEREPWVRLIREGHIARAARASTGRGRASGASCSGASSTRRAPSDELSCCNVMIEFLRLLRRLETPCRAYVLGV